MARPDLIVDVPLHWQVSPVLRGGRQPSAQEVEALRSGSPLPTPGLLLFPIMLSCFTQIFAPYEVGRLARAFHGIHDSIGACILVLRQRSC